MDFNKIAGRVAKFADADEIYDEQEWWASYIAETMSNAENFIGKLGMLKDFLNISEDSPDDKWRRTVALAIEAKDVIANDPFVIEAEYMRSKLHGRVQLPFYAVSAQHGADPAKIAQDEQAVRELMAELSQLLKQYRSR